MWTIFVILGIVTGLMSALGLGGGTLLIPILSLVGVGQKEAQLINVFSFVVMASIILIFNIKNGLVDVFPAVVFSSVAVPFAVLMAICVKGIDEHALKITFGVFLLSIGVVELVCYLKKYHSK
jgi:uncharacterized protein